jgi:serine phosphatase RsbU (regulator of sigma subunit)
VETIGACLALSLANERQIRRQKSTEEAVNALKSAENLQSRQKQLKAVSRNFHGTVYAYETRAQSVAGDVIECAIAPDGGKYMLIADVMGKGVAAALLAGVFRGGWHLLYKQQTHPLILVNQLNSYLFDELNGQTMFVTAALAHLSPKGDNISIVNAGHTPIYLQKPNGELTVIESSGPPLGLFMNPKYELRCFDSADFIRLYMPTDGLYSFGKSAAHFDPKTLESLFKENHGKQADELWKLLQQSNKNAPERYLDDQSLLIWDKESKR